MSAKYQVVIKDFADTTTFGPGNPIAILEDAVHVGWSEYINEVGELFFTVSQEDPKIATLNTALNYGKHVHLYRDGVLVWGGWLGEADETMSDVVFTAHSYVSGFYYYLMEWGREWVAQDADQIIEDAFDYAKAKTKSRVGWMTKGTIQNLVTTSGGAVTLTMPLYKASFKRVLSLFREIAAYAISDTTNQVQFEVTPAGVFNLWKSVGSTLTDARWSLKGGKFRSYNRKRLPVDARNEIVAVGSSPNDVALRTTITGLTSQVASQAALGLKQEPIYFSWIRDATELDRVAKIRAYRALRLDTDLYVSFFRDGLIPYRATGATYAIGDRLDPHISRGLTTMTGSIVDRKIIVGQQVIYSGGSEYVRLLLADAL